LLSFDASVVILPRIRRRSAGGPHHAETQWRFSGTPARDYVRGGLAVSRPGGGRCTDTAGGESGAGARHAVATSARGTSHRVGGEQCDGEVDVSLV